jgi:hypothetical protein
MKTFAFILSLYNAESPSVEIYLQGHSLSGAECIAAMTFYNTYNPNWTDGEPSCVIDDNGYWAKTELYNNVAQNDQY